MLDKVRMNVTQTATNGIVNGETFFDFRQAGNNVEAKYAGGKIESGYLVGRLEDNLLHFTYCQLRVTGELDHGESTCAVSIEEESGKVKLEEQFKMSTQGSSEEGVNIIMEL